MGAQGSVSTLSLIFMFISAALAILLPIGLMIWLAVKRRLNIKAALLGAGFFILFALILETLVHMLVLRGMGLQSTLLKNPLLYGLYGGLAAGIFEETARLLGFKIIVRHRETESINTGISYGVGHGGIEAILVGGIPIIGNIATALMINNGMMNAILKNLPAAQAEASRQVVNSLVSAPSYLFGVSGFERAVALLIQISLSIFVFKAIVERKWIYYIYAIIIHAAIDFPAALYQAGAIKSIFVVELIVLACAVLVAYAAYKIRPVFPGRNEISESTETASDENSADLIEASADDSRPEGSEAGENESRPEGDETSGNGNSQEGNEVQADEDTPERNEVPVEDGMPESSQR